MAGQKWLCYVKRMAQQKDAGNMMTAQSTQSMQHICTMACSCGLSNQQIVISYLKVPAPNQL